MNPTPFALGKLLALVETAVPASVRVYDGPKPTSSNADLCVLIGHDGVLDSVNPYAVETSSWVNVGRHRDSRIDITCAVVGQSGSTGLSNVRGDSYDLLDAVTAAIHADPSFGTTNVIRNAEVSRTSYEALQTGTGATVRLIFTVSLIARS